MSLARVPFIITLACCSAALASPQAVWENLISTTNASVPGVKGAVWVPNQYNNPTIDATGRVVFRGQIGGAGITTANSKLYMAGTPSNWVIIARDGSPVPGGIPSGYVFNTSAGINGLGSSNNISTAAANQLAWSSTVLGAGASYQDRPTISYAPLSGDRFTKRLIRPIPPVGIFELIQSGHPADVVLQMTVRSLNGIKNQGISGGVLEPADPEFYPLLDALRRLQNAGRLRTASTINESHFV